ncbi:MAG: hypothetical protein KDD45_15000, partial [Bdellovibrionales bacterium]|nr:hypothetical protein [Bdellovibrionales bacterium]
MLQVPGSTPASFLKKKNTYEGTTNPSFGQINPRRNSAQMGQDATEYDQNSLRKLILKEHGEATRGLHI